MIRAAIPADILSLPAVERSAAERFRGTHMDWAADGGTVPLPVLARAMARGQLWVAEVQGGEVAGFLLAESEEGDLFIKEVSVALPHQGRGIGRALLRHAGEAAQAAGHTALALTTDSELPWNALFYARLGFRRLDHASLTPALRRRLAAEASLGLDMSRRCAMRLFLPEQERRGDRTP